MNWYEIIRDILVLIVILFLGVQIGKTNNEITTLKGSVEKRLGKGTAQVKTIIVEKINLRDLEPIVKKAIHKEFVKQRGIIISNIKGSWSSRKNEQDKTTRKYGVKKKTIYWKNGEDLLPIAVAFYSPNKEMQGKDPWIAKSFDLIFRTDIIQERKNGRIRNIVSIKAKPKNLKGWENRWFRIDPNLVESHFEIKQEKLIPSFSFFDPKVNITITYNIKNKVFEPAGSINLFSYGIKNSDQWRFLTPFVSTSGNYGIEAFSYNIGNQIKFLRDTFIGFGVDKNKNILLFLSSTL